MKAFKVLAVLAIVALVGSGFALAPTASAQSNVIKIASQSPLSGGQSVLGTAISNGARLAIEQLSKPIEDLGFKIEYVPFDDQATPDVGVSNAQNIVNDAAILAVIGHLNSGVAIPASEVYNKSDLVMVSPANTNPAVTDRGLPTVVRICGRDDTQGTVGANYALNELKAKTAYVIHDKTAYGEGVATFFRDVFQANGGEVLGFEGTEEKANFDAILTPIVASAPDVIYFGGIYDQAALFFKQAREKGLTSQFMGADGLDSSDLVKIGGEAMIGTVFTSTAGPAELFPEAKQFIEDYKKTFKTEIVETYAAEAYAATQVVLAGIEAAIKANNGALPTRKQVTEAVRATKDLNTVIGSITLDGNGDKVEATYYILKAVGADPAGAWKELLTTTTAPSPLAAKAK
jgi:branched-chain amino acid transport system substrate-binding protein